MRRQLASGAYDRLGTLDAFTQKLTEDLRSVSHDLHLGVGWDPEPPAPETGGPTPEEQQALFEAGMRRDNYWLPQGRAAGRQRRLPQARLLRAGRSRRRHRGGGDGFSGRQRRADLRPAGQRRRLARSMVQLLASYLFSASRPISTASTSARG